MIVRASLLEKCKEYCAQSSSQPPPTPSLAYRTATNHRKLAKRPPSFMRGGIASCTHVEWGRPREAIAPDMPGACQQCGHVSQLVLCASTIFTSPFCLFVCATPCGVPIFSGNGRKPLPDFRPPGVTLGDKTLRDCNTGIGVIAVCLGAAGTRSACARHAGGMSARSRLGRHPNVLSVGPGSSP